VSIIREQPLHRNFQLRGPFFLGSRPKEPWSIFDARKVAAKKPGAFLEVTLRQLFLFSQSFQFVANDQGSFLQSAQVATGVSHQILHGWFGEPMEAPSSIMRSLPCRGCVLDVCTVQPGTFCPGVLEKRSR
jgi:hypothetical protein